MKTTTILAAAAIAIGALGAAAPAVAYPSYPVKQLYTDTEQRVACPVFQGGSCIWAVYPYASASTPTYLQLNCPSSMPYVVGPTFWAPYYVERLNSETNGSGFDWDKFETAVGGTDTRPSYKGKGAADPGYVTVLTLLAKKGADYVPGSYKLGTYCSSQAS